MQHTRGNLHAVCKCESAMSNSSEAPVRKGDDQDLCIALYSSCPSCAACLIVVLPSLRKSVFLATMTIKGSIAENIHNVLHDLVNRRPVVKKCEWNILLDAVIDQHCHCQHSPCLDDLHSSIRRMELKDVPFPFFANNRSVSRAADRSDTPSPA